MKQRRDTRGSSPEAPPLGVGVELAWRVHMLHPLTYLQAASALATVRPTDDAVAAAATAASARQDPAPTPGDGADEWAGVDLVAAMRRQAGFMRGALDARAVLGTPDAVARAVRQYRQFLELAQGTARPLAPTVPIDLAWHC